MTAPLTHRGRVDQDLRWHFNASGASTAAWFAPKGWRIRHRRLEVYFGDPLQVAVR